MVPEERQYRHLDEGMDDIPAHVKSSLMGASLTVPIQQGRLALGTWQVGTLPVLLSHSQQHILLDPAVRCSAS